MTTLIRFPAIAARIPSRFTETLRRLRYWRNSRIAHWKRALAYGRGTLTPADASWIAYDCARISGCYALESIDVEGVLDLARDRWGDHPELERLAGDAVARVADKWSGGGDYTSAAQDWALELIAEYAKAETIALEDGCAAPTFAGGSVAPTESEGA